MSKDFIDRFNEEGSKDRFWSLNKKIGAGLVVLLLAVIMINTSGCTQGNSDSSGDDITAIEANQEQQQKFQVLCMINLTRLQY